MTQADSVHSTPPTNTSAFSERVERDAKSHRGMDGDLCDIVHMGKIAAMLVCASDGDSTREARSLATFAVYHLEKMLIRLKAKYDGHEWAVA